MKYFTIDELTRSATARRLGIDNRPTAEHQSAMVALIDTVLDPLREAWGHPISVNSGYRCAALNRAVGGTTTSQHMKGEAADITTGNVADNKRLFDLAISLGLPFDQLIDERHYSWLHISHRRAGNNRRQVKHL